MIRRGFAAVLAALLLLAAASASAQAFEPFVVKDIRVEGLQRTEAGTVFSYLPVKVGETLDQAKAQQALRALYATGFFQDVRLEADNGVLVVFVQERPAIASIDFSGMKELDPENVRKILRDLGMAEGRIFDRALLESTQIEIKRQYLARGMYAADVQTTVTPLERNRVGINIAVTEGEVAKIRGINLVGVTAFGEKELLDEFVLRTPGWLTWYTKNDRYSREKLAADLETLRAFYQNRGYLDFNIESTQVSITPDRRDVYITVNVTEGEKYTVSKVEVSGHTVVPREELEKLVQLKPGDVFSREKLAASTKAIADRLGNDGYAFANANAIPQVDKEKRTVAFNLVVDPGRRVYVRRIEIAGNNKTSDEVIRREMRQLEGGYYDASKIQLSRRRIDRTQYFSEVNVETQPVEGNPDQVDVLYTVKEKPTGALLFGVGFSSVEKISLSASLTQSNVFGTGKFLSFNINSGSVNKVYSLSYLNPYFTVDGVSQGFDVYRRKTDASALAVGPYATDSYGGGIKFGYPTSEVTRYDFGLNAESVELTTFSTSPLAYLNFVRDFGNAYTYGALTAGVSRDTRDSLIVTTAGSLMRLSSEFAQGDLEYYRLRYQQQYYRPLSPRLTLMLGGEIGVAGGLGGLPLPFFKNFYAGGPDSVRGYRPFSLGPKDELGNSLGGNRSLTGSAQVLFPMPGAAHDPSVRLSWFVDAGNVFSQSYDLHELRYSTGLALFWSSPFGPLKLSFAQPLRAQNTDHIQRLQFTFGTGF
ncbi:MAG TPA: outer membrane protein assembly factor BamA [Burkholderiales bacterium]|jgi:outer membrane protein insertion porin family|nr:outer membrane protein assembly factor BamA [Burkholderiales bacterium]